MSGTYPHLIPFNAAPGPLGQDAVQQLRLQMSNQSDPKIQKNPKLRALLFIGMGALWTMVGLAAWFCFQWNAQMGSFPKLLKLDFYKNLKLELEMWHNLESKYRGTYGKFNGTYRREGDPSSRLLMLSSGNAVVIQLKQDNIEIKEIEGVHHISWDDRHSGKFTTDKYKVDIKLVDEDGDTSKHIIMTDGDDDNIKNTYFLSELTESQLNQLKAANHDDLTEDDKSRFDDESLIKKV